MGLEVSVTTGPIYGANRRRARNEPERDWAQETEREWPIPPPSSVIPPGVQVVLLVITLLASILIGIAFAQHFAGA